MGLGIALAAASGVKALGSYAYNRYKNNKRPKFGDSAYGEELQRIGREGKFSGNARNDIVGRTARESANIGQTGKASFAGRLASQGLEGSVAGQRGLNEFDIQRQEDVSRAGQDVELQNEQSKVDANLSYGQQLLADEQGLSDRHQQNAGQLISGLGSAAAQGITGYFQGKAMTLAEIQKARAAGNITEREYALFVSKIDPNG